MEEAMPVLSAAKLGGVFLPLDQIINGTEGNDWLYDGIGNDTIYAGGGHDGITLGAGNDTVYAGFGNDIVYDHGSGNDTMYGEFGDDYFFVGLGNDVVDGGAGKDGVSYLYSQQIVALDLESGWAISEGIDQLISIEDAAGGIGNDTLLGSSVANYLYGADGEDKLDGRGGDDYLWGGAGGDNIIGGTGRDTLVGDYGNDRLDGGADNDVVWGGWGDDVMAGGAGADTFYFSSKNDIYNYDTITDFQHGIDKIDLRGIDARPDIAGNQAFTFDSTPDGSVEEFFDGFSDDWGGLISSDPGPWINGDTGEVEYRHDGGYTYIYLSYGDGLTDVSIRLEGTITLSASDFLL
jgi:Ca2+-binding RTX toxin-like protein